MKFKIISFLILLSTFYFLFSFGVFAQTPTYSLPPLPTGSGYTQGEIEGILIRFANFLIAVGVVLGIITIVVSGIMYFKAGSDTKAESAKAWFKNGVIGAFIILAVGVIILTIYNIVVTRTFFGGPTIPGVPGAPVPGQSAPGAQPPTGGVPPAGGSGTRNIGDRCVDPSECKSELICNQTTKICKRINGNLQNEKCEGNSDCLAGLVCGRSFGSLFLRKECKSGSGQSGPPPAPGQPPSGQLCQLSRILTSKQTARIADDINIVVVATGATNCVGSSVVLYKCQGSNCSSFHQGTFTGSTFPYTWSVIGINPSSFYFKATAGSSTVQSPVINYR